jgi:hypothetical protein
MKKLTFLLPIILATWTLSCGGSRNYSGPVGVNLRAQSGDVTGGTISSDKIITTEPGNPYGAFINDARVKLGRDPSNVQVSALTLSLGAQSSGVTALEQVYSGRVDVLFLMLGTGISYSVGHMTNYAGGGPINLTIDFDSTQIVGQDHFNLMSGSFRVVTRGTAAPGFDTRSADASLQHNFTFKAVE